MFDPSVFARQFEQLTEMKKQVETLTSQLKVAQDQLGQAKQLYEFLQQAHQRQRYREPPELLGVPEISALGVLKN